MSWHTVYYDEVIHLFCTGTFVNLFAGCFSAKIYTKFILLISCVMYFFSFSSCSRGPPHTTGTNLPQALYGFPFTTPHRARRTSFYCRLLLQQHRQPSWNYCQICVWFKDVPVECTFITVIKCTSTFAIKS